MLGGFAIVLYYILGFMVCCLVNKKFENYLASELYMATEAVVVDGGEGGDVEPAAGCCGGKSALTVLRNHTKKSFYNDIIGKDEQVLNCGNVGCMSKSRIDRIFT